MRAGIYGSCFAGHELSIEPWCDPIGQRAAGHFFSHLDWMCFTIAQHLAHGIQ
jgi:hypothetical protein